jgi:hypothetical protein
MRVTYHDNDAAFNNGCIVLITPVGGFVDESQPEYDINDASTPYISVNLTPHQHSYE